MDLDSSLIMQEFLSGFSSFLILLGFGSIVALLLATIFILIEHKPWKKYPGDNNGD